MIRFIMSLAAALSGGWFTVMVIRSLDQRSLYMTLTITVALLFGALVWRVFPKPKKEKEKADD